MIKKYTLAEAKELLEKSKKPKIVRKTKSKTRVGNHIVKRVEYLTANPVRKKLPEFKTVFAIEVIKRFQFPTDKYYVGTRSIVRNYYEAKLFSSKSAATNAAEKLRNNANISPEIRAFKVVSMRG
jgi:hypothetical protein